MSEGNTRSSSPDAPRGTIRGARALAGLGMVAVGLALVLISASAIS
jgi:hypothetical protein